MARRRAAADARARGKKSAAGRGSWRAPGACVAGGAHKARTARRKQNGGTLCGVSVEYTGYVGDL